MAAAFRRAAARRDLVEHYVYLAENAGEDVADRFVANAEASFTGLSEYPEMGAPLTLRHPELAGLRKWQVNGFEKFLIFYMPRQVGVTIVRALHAAQDCGVYWEWMRRRMLAGIPREPSPRLGEFRAATRRGPTR